MGFAPMNVSRHQVSLGALALILCLALPMGVLSLFSPSTTGDQVDAADAAVVARVTSMQVIREEDRTVVGLHVQKMILGDRTSAMVQLSVEGRPSIEVGDLVVALLRFEPDEILGVYQMQKDRFTLQYEVVTPITGMFAQGISDLPPVPFQLFETAIAVRRSGGGVDPNPGVDPDVEDEPVIEAVAEDGFEPNDDLAAATPVFLDPPAVLTGNPTMVTGLTLHEGDVDFFGFDGPGLSILHAQTRTPRGVTDLELDTLMGLFDATSGDLLAVDDDGGQGKLSRLTVPLEYSGPYAVAVESAPDSNLDFDGDEGTTTGAYELDLEVEKAAYLTNENDIILGVSPDHTFIEDFIGFKQVGGQDVLLVGVPADGWGVSYTLEDRRIELLTGIFGGAGEQLGDPGFNTELVQLDFELGPFVDSNGFNRAGFARSTTMVPSNLDPLEGVLLRMDYTIGDSQTTVDGLLVLRRSSSAEISDVLYQRVMDVDLFGTGDDTFYYSFDASGLVKAFPVDTKTVVGGAAAPSETQGVITGDMQFALEAQGAPLSGPGSARAYGLGFTLVKEFSSEADAVAGAVANLTAHGHTTWIVAVDVDPVTGLFSAFGAGMHTKPQ